MYPNGWPKEGPHWSKRTQAKEPPKQLQTHNLPTDDNKGKYLLLANKLRFVRWRTKKIPQKIQRHNRVTLNRSTHPEWEQDQMEKASYGLDWLQKGIWYGSAKLDNKLLQNVQNITCSHKLYRQKHENLESWIDSRRKKLSWSKDPKRYFSRRCSITVTIHNCHDAT